MRARYDIAIIGAGIAGAALAAEIGTSASVIVLEAESVPGYHATGRSAAFWTESYGGAGVQPLTTASGAYLQVGGFLTKRGALTIAREGDEARLEAFAAQFAALGVRVEMLDRARLEAVMPGLKPGWASGAFEPDCSDIDVAALHQHYLAAARRADTHIVCNARLIAAMGDRSWRLELADGRTIIADILVDAAGAWADEVAAIAKVRPLGIAPLLRTVAQIRTSPPPPAALPLVLDLDEQFYFKPESGKVWLSPHDEVPSPPCDAGADELGVAQAIARFGEVVDWTIERVEHRWAGLRCFAPDRLPVYGFDPANPRFFWCAGQGGFGIQTAPAASRMAADLLLGRPIGTVDPHAYRPSRFG